MMKLWFFDTMSLAEKSCVPCRGGVPPMEPEKVDQMLAQLNSGWSATHGAHASGTKFHVQGFCRRFGVCE